MIPQDAGSTPAVQCFHAAKLGECLWFFEQFQHSSTPTTKKVCGNNHNPIKFTIKSLPGAEP